MRIQVSLVPGQVPPFGTRRPRPILQVLANLLMTGAFLEHLSGESTHVFNR
jgi:hypothetical protein